MDFAETDEHRDLRAAVGAIASGFGPRYYAEHAAAREPCTELWARLAEAGFIGVNVPEEYGGGGGGITELSIVGEELAAQGTPLLLLLVSAAICAEVIAEFGTEEQRKTWLPGLAAGTSKMVFAITEPDAGSNTHRLATTAVRDGDDWLLTGTKYYISGVDEAEALMVVARTGQDEPRRRHAVAVRRAHRRAGLAGPGAAGRRHAARAPVHAALRRGPGRARRADRRRGRGLPAGLPRPEPRADHERRARRRRRPARPGRGGQVRPRAPGLATPIGAHQGVSHPLAKAKIETELAALMTRQAAWQHDRRLPAGESSNMAKYAAAEAALAAVDAAIQTHGGNGLATEYGLVPYLGLARLLRIAPVNREMVLNFVAQHSLGLPRSY